MSQTSAVLSDRYSHSIINGRGKPLIRLDFLRGRLEQSGGFMLPQTGNGIKPRLRAHVRAGAGSGRSPLQLGFVRHRLRLRLARGRNCRPLQPQCHQNEPGSERPENPSMSQQDHGVLVFGGHHQDRQSSRHQERV